MDRDEQRALEESLELMPRVVRDKLDRVGIKLHLAEWQMLAMVERERLRDQVCGTDAEAEAYRLEIDRMGASAMRKGSGPAAGAEALAASPKRAAPCTRRGRL